MKPRFLFLFFVAKTLISSSFFGLFKNKRILKFKTKLLHIKKKKKPVSIIN